MRNLLKADASAPRPESREPVRATGAVTAVGLLLAALGVRYLGMDPEIAFGVGMVLGPIITAELGRLQVFSQATVARFQSVRGER